MLAIWVVCLVVTFNYATNFIYHGRLYLLVFDIVILDTSLEILDSNLEVSDIVLEISDGNSVMIDVDFKPLDCQVVSFNFNLFLHLTESESVILFVYTMIEMFLKVNLI